MCLNVYVFIEYVMYKLQYNYLLYQNLTMRRPQTMHYYQNNPIYDDIDDLAQININWE